MASSPTPPPSWPSPVAAAVAHLFGHILGRPAPGAHETFASLGGAPDGVEQAARAIRTAFGVELPSDLLRAGAFTAADVAGAIAAAKAPAAEGPAAPAVLDSADWRPALPTQATCYFVDKVTRGDARPTITGAVVIEGPLDRGRLDAAVAAAWMRHDGLRLRFSVKRREVLIRPADAAPEIEEIEPAGGDEACHIRAASRRGAQRLDLDEGPGVHWSLASLAPDRHVLVAVAHHAVADAIARGLLLKEIGEAYANGAAADSLGPAPSFMAVAAGRHAAMTSPRAEAAEAYWRQYLAPEAGDLALPGLASGGDRPECRRLVRSYVLEAAAVDRLLAEAAAHSATPFVAFAGLFARCFAGDGDAQVLVPVSNRDLPGRQNVVGCLVHTVPLRLSAGLAASYDRLREDVVQMLAHAMLPVQELLAREVLAHEARGMLDSPIAVQFQVRRSEAELVVDRPDLRVRRLDPVLGVNNLLPLSIDIKRGAETVVHCDYDPGLVDPAGLDRMIRRIEEELAA